MVKRRRRTVRVRSKEEAHEEEPVVNEVVDEDDEVVEEPAVKNKGSVRRRRKVKVVEEPVVDEDDEVVEEPVVDEDDEVVEEPVKVGNQMFSDLLAKLDEDHVMHIRLVEPGMYEISILSAASAIAYEKPATSKVSKVSVDDMLTDEFKEWRREWAKLTYEEKVASAEEAGVEWDRHENPKVDVMRLSAAMREAEGIEKWKPEYSTRKARAAARGK